MGLVILLLTAVIAMLILSEHTLDDDERGLRLTIAIVACFFAAIGAVGLFVLSNKLTVSGKSYSIETTVTTVEKNGVVDSDTTYTIQVNR
jgi:hypothetical protein